MAVKHIKGTEVKSSLPKGVSILNISAVWCGPCKMLGPVLEEISESTPVFRVELDDNKEFAKEMGVQGVPSLFIYKDGEIVDKLVGFVPLSEIENRLKNIS